MSVEIREMPFCCGMNIVCNFGGTYYTAGNERKVTIEELEKQLEEAENASYSCSMILSTLNEDQYRLYRKVFIKKGWRCVRKGVNQLHNNINYLMIKVINEE